MNNPSAVRPGLHCNFGGRFIWTTKPSSPSGTRRARRRSSGGDEAISPRAGSVAVITGCPSAGLSCQCFSAIGSARVEASRGLPFVVGEVDSGDDAGLDGDHGVHGTVDPRVQQPLAAREALRVGDGASHTGDPDASANVPGRVDIVGLVGDYHVWDAAGVKRRSSPSAGYE